MENLKVRSTLAMGGPPSSYLEDNRLVENR